MTQYERIMSMSVEGLAQFLGNYFDCAACPVRWQDFNCYTPDCYKAFKNWLESEVKDETE